MALTDQERGTLQLLIEAAKADQLGLIETTDKKGNRIVAVTTMQTPEEGKYLALPVAKLFDGSPFAELNPPDGAEELQNKATKH